MPSASQIPIHFTHRQRLALKRLSSSRGVSVATIVREAVDAHLKPPAPREVAAAAMWDVLQDPACWARFKQIAGEMEAAAAPPAAEPATPVAPPPTWRHQRQPGVLPRARSEAPTTDEEPPF